MRDVVFALVVIGLLPACFRRPFIGLLVFSWLAYMRGQDLTWGFARTARWSYYVALVTIAGFMSGERKRLFVPDLRCWVMILLAILTGLGLVATGSLDAYRIGRFSEFCKIIFVALFTTAVVTTREQLRVLVWIIALSLGFYGVKSGVWGIMTLGQVPILRGPGGMLADNNDFSLALAMAVPLLYSIGKAEKRGILRRAFLVTVPLTIITVGLTRSRGGFLSVSSALFVLVWRSRNRVGGIIVLVLAGLAAAMLAPESYKKRLGTIVEYQSEGSAMGRIKSWMVATRMAVDNPIFGVGYGNFRQNYLKYEPDPTPQQLAGEDIIVAHNSYLQIWAETGTPVLVTYLTLIGATFVALRRVQAAARRRYFASWILSYATMFEASLVAFVVGSTFLNRAHFDLLYHFIAIVIVFEQIATREMKDETAHPVRTGSRGEIRATGGTGFGRRRVRPGFRNTPLLPRGA